MARDFDGTNDRLAVVDALTNMTAAPMTIGYWFVRRTSGTANMCFFILSETATTGGRTLCDGVVTAGVFKPEFTQTFTTANGLWIVTNALTVGQRYFISYVYDRGATTNDPTFYVDGVAVVSSETATPSGTANSNTDSIVMGERAAGTFDLDGQLQHVYATPELFSAAEVNTAMWWGRARGGLTAYWPFLTDKLANEGVQAATLTATGTTVNSLVTPTVRPGSAMMGMGIGW